MMPQYLARGLPVAFIGAITVPIALSIKDIKITLKDPWYYPTTLGLSALCWMIVIVNWVTYAI
jgi:hypothetical protein